MIPSGNKGLPGCRGDRGDLAGRADNAEVLEESPLGSAEEIGAGGAATDLGLGRVLRGGSRTL